MQDNTQIKPRNIPRFTKLQLTQIYIWIMEGIENRPIMDRFKKAYYPDNNTLTDNRTVHNFMARVQNHRNALHEDVGFEKIIRWSQQGIAKKNIRLFQLKKRAGETIDKLDAMAETPDQPAEYDSPEDMDPKDTPEYSKTKEYIALNTLLLKQLSHIAEEVGDIKKGVQFNIDNRRIIFEGKAVVPQLDEAGMKALQAKNRVEESDSG